MDSLDFSEEEIEEQLAVLGYKNLPKHKLQEFKRDLDDLIRRGKWLNSSTSQSAGPDASPPAYTKEKVSESCSQNADRQAFAVRHNRDCGWRRGHADSYAQHSVTPKRHPPPGVSTRRPQAEPDAEESDSHASTPDGQEKRFIKRKVLRKHNGRSLVCDESVYSEASDAASLLEELNLSTSRQRDEENDHGTVQSSEDDRVSFSAFESYITDVTRTRSDADLRPKPKSFIRPSFAQQAVKKTDPVAKYFQYKQFWEMFKLPGETDRRALRRQIKEQLEFQPPPPKPRRVFVPNTYVVPTEKKRSALRWEIRNDLANGLLPHKFSYRL